MMSDTTNDPREIEADLEQVRSGLASDLDELSNRASIDYIAREALGMIKINTSDATRTLDRAMRDNPTAFALVGLGLAWMVLGGKKGSNTAQTRSYSLHADDPNPDWHSGVGGLRQKAMDALSRIESEARSVAGSLQSKLSGQMENVRDFAAERAGVVESFTADLKNSISEGLEHLSESAREQVMSAREQSYAAWLRTQRVVKGGSREVVTLVEEHPVAVGAVALAVGAVAGMAFLRSGEADRNDPAYWTRGQGKTPNPVRSVYRNTASGTGAASSGVVSTGGAGTAEGGRAMSDTNPTGSVPPL